jgi:small subunit ribosomal protein S6
MRIYEELFILKPDTSEEDAEAYITQVKDLITAGKGTIDKVEKWGVRKLAYRVAKCNEGNYTLIQFTAPSELVHEVERRMRVTDSVIKFITVRIDEKMKKIEKRKKARDKRAARKPPPPPMTPAIPAMLGVPAAVPGGAVPGAPAAAAPGLPEAGKTEAPKAEVHKPEAPKPEAPKSEAPTPEKAEE